MDLYDYKEAMIESDPDGGSRDQYAYTEKQRANKAEFRAFWATFQERRRAAELLRKRIKRSDVLGNGGAKRSRRGTGVRTVTFAPTTRDHETWSQDISS